MIFDLFISSVIFKIFNDKIVFFYGYIFIKSVYP